jgi:hypothetical protein
MDQYDNTESQLAFSFNDQDFMDFLPATDEEQFRSRWSDFNFHDPGVTAYEALQYSFEDFFYRYNFPITDLLQGPKTNAFDDWSLRELHTFYAVTENDYRRLLASSEYLYNIAVKPVLKANTPPGTVELICLLNVDVATAPVILPICIQKNWEDDLIYNRALGEYFNRQIGCQTFICENMKYVDVQARVTFVPEGVPIEKNQLLRAALEDYLLPILESMDYRYVTKNGKEQREAHNGPLIRDDYQNNVIEEEELTKPSFRKLIIVSELYAVLEGLDFVQSVESIEIALEDGVYQSSILDLGEYTFTQLRTLNLNGRIVLYPLRVNVRKSADSNQSNFETSEMFTGKFRHLGYSQTLQDSFPANYKMGKNLISQDLIDLEETASFRAYLYLMDQIRADLTAQMGNLWDIFTVQPTQPDIEEDNTLRDHVVYTGIKFDPVPPNGGYRARIQTLDYVFDEERLNYLLALNGWGVATDAIIFWNVTGYDQIKNDFLNLVNSEISINTPVNKELNPVFRSKSLVMLQEKLRVLLQNEEANIRILEHFMLQPVWQEERGLNFEISILLFSRDVKRYPEGTELGHETHSQEAGKYKAYVHGVIRMLAPAHLVTHIVWKNEKQLDHFDGLLKTAFPPNDVYYLNQAITPQQRFAMTDLRDNWL